MKKILWLWILLWSFKGLHAQTDGAFLSGPRGVKLFVMPLTMVSVEPRVRVGMELPGKNNGYAFLVSSDISFWDPGKFRPHPIAYRSWNVQTALKHYHGKPPRAYWQAEIALLRRRMDFTRRHEGYSYATGYYSAAVPYRLTQWYATMYVGLGRMIPLGRHFYTDMHIGMGPRLDFISVAPRDGRPADPRLVPLVEEPHFKCGLPFIGQSGYHRWRRLENDIRFGFGLRIDLRVGWNLGKFH